VSGGTGTGGAFQSGDDPEFAFATLTVNDNDPDDEFVIIEFNAIVNNVASNQAGTTLAKRVHSLERHDRTSAPRHR